MAVVLALGLVTAALAGSRLLMRSSAAAERTAPDVFAASQIRDLRQVLELYRRENGRYPDRLSRLIEDDWITADRLAIPDYRLRYTSEDSGRDYRIDLDRAR